MKVKAGALLLISLSIGLSARAQLDTLKIAEVTITAAPALKVPHYALAGSHQHIDKTLISSTWSRTGAEILENASGVWLQKTNHGGGAPIVRGLTGNQVLLMFDGIRLNNSIYRYGPNQYLSQINPSWVSQIDLKRGAGSVEYGSDALGGVINLQSRDARFTKGNQLRINFGTSIGTHYRFKNATEMTFTGLGTFTSQNFYVDAGYTVSNFGNLISGKPETLQPASGYREQAGQFKYAHKINENNVLTIAWFRDIQKEVGRTDKALSGYDEYHFDPQILDLGYARWSSTTTNRWVKKIEATVSYNRLDEDRRIKKEKSETRNLDSDLVHSLGAAVLALSEITPNWTADSGLEYYHDRVNSSAYHEDLLRAIRTEYRGLYTDHSRMQSASVFSNHIIRSRKTHVNIGARLNQTLIQGEDEEFGNFDVSPTALVGSAGINYELLNGLALTASLNTGFRSPNINDISSFGLFDYGFEVPAPELKPEKSLNTEVGIKLFRNRFSATIAAYQTNLFDLIVREKAWYLEDTVYNGERVYQKTNSERALIRGIEADASWIPLSRLLVEGFVTYTYGKDLERGNPLRRIPPLFAQIKASYPVGDQIIITGVMKAAGSQTRLSNGDIDDDRIPDGGTPGWYCIDISGSWVAEQWILSLHVLNLTNQDYRIHGSGLQQPGRGFLVKLASRL